MLKTVGFPSSRTGDQTIINGNLVIATAGKGIDFSATGSGTGTPTSELFDDYEVGTFTPTITSGAGVTTTNSASGFYTKVGNVVVALMDINIDTDAAVGTSNFTIGGLPYVAAAFPTAARGFVTYSNWTSSDLNDGALPIYQSTNSLFWFARSVSGSSRTNNLLSFVVVYRT